MCSILNFLRFIHIIFVMLVFQVRYSFILVSCWKASDANVSCIHKERQALLDFKHALQDDYGRLSSWGTTQDCCNWSGVRCNLQNGHVERLDLHDGQLGYQPLSGDISTSLMKLQHLKYLNLSYNDFNGSHIPDFFGSLSKLICLDLSYASFGGIIPYKLGKLLSLQVLDLGSNNLAGEIPYQLGNLSNLQELNLNYNYLIGNIPYQLGNISSLQILCLGYNGNLKIGDKSSTSTDWISNLSSLIQLDLSYVFNLNSSSNGLQGIGKLPNLRLLRLRSCNLTDINLLSMPHLHLNFFTSLVTLSLSYNNLTSSIFPWLFNLSSNLVDLYLTHNQLIGSIPKDFGKTMNNLERLMLSHNQLNGVVSEIHFDNLTKLQWLDLSSNSLTLKFSSNWIPSFQLQYLRLRQCKLGPSFPSWLQTQHNMRELDISYAGILDSVPMWFWSLTTQVKYLDMSFNNFTGIILNQSIKFTIPTIISLANNQIEGPIPLFLLSASWLNLLNNKFSKLPPTLCDCDENCDVDVGSLTLLELSNNHISGQLPHCWGNFKSLEYLTLFNNKLSGKIPISMGSLFRMHVLILSNNELNGDFPPLKNCTSLKMIDLGGNQLSGTIPSWIWDSPSLDMLVLRENKFNGSLPMHLCHAKSIQVLDLSFNLLSGGIPKCLNNFTAMAQEHQKHNDANELFVYKNGSLVKLQFTYGLYPYLVWKGRETLYPNTHELLNTIDLSHNKLSGEIPTEIASLVGLVSLNLSTNNLSGEIISEIAELKSLEVLDLSRNQFSGRIPSSLSKMTLLNSLDVSYNNLSGEIPIGTQLQSFDSSSYEGNPYLCGKPLERACPSSSHEGQKEVDDDDEDLLLTQGFYLSMGLGFFIGFWGIFGSILFNRSWRHAYFNFLNNLMDNIYVISMPNIARLRRWFKT